MIGSRGAARGRSIGGIAIAVGLALVQPAFAGEVVVLESYAEKRHPDAEYLLAPLFAELTSRDYLTGRTAVSALIERRLSQPGRSLSEHKQTTARRLVNSGYEHWIAGRFEQAATDLGRALDVYHGAPAIVARDQTKRDLVEKALVVSALAHKRLGHERESHAFMAEMIRSFPDRPVDRVVYGPEATKLYRGVKRKLDKSARAILRIEVDDPKAVVFLNERYLAVGSTIQNDLHAGLYRVFVRRGEASGRTHIVELDPDQELTISIDSDLDVSLRTAVFPGFEFADESTRANREADYAVRVARGIGANGVVVVGIREDHGRQAIIGTVYSLDDGKPLRSAALTIEPNLPPAKHIRALARYLAGDEAAPGLDILIGAPLTARASAGPSADVWPWAAMGVGVVGLIGSGYLLHVDGSGDCSLDTMQRQCQRERETKVAGILTAVASAALIGTGIYLWRRRARGGAETHVTVTPATHGVAAVFQMSF